MPNIASRTAWAVNDYQDTWQLVDRMIKAQRRRQEPDTGSGWAAAVGLLNVYLVEAIQDMSPRQREAWHRKLKDITHDMEQEIIMKRLSQEETYE
jgi:hypothetical protein